MGSKEFTDTAPVKLPDQHLNGDIINPEKIVVRQTVKYCLYARKSTEDDEKQALSIESQIKEMAEIGRDQGLTITDIRREAHSAKASGLRPVFNQLLQDIKSGIFQGILTWAPDRLSRNAGDLGVLVDLMDSGSLREIRTHSQNFTNSPNEKFLLMILCSQAKLENDNRGLNVMRGMRAKCAMGYRPGMAPLGYLNERYADKGKRRVFLDPERAPIIKRAFEKIAYEGYTGRAIYTWLNEEAGFRTRGDKKISLSMVYEMLNKSYYCGIFEYPEGTGNWYKVAHESIISRELFEKVQERMMVVPKSKPGTKEFDFTRILKCGNCGSGVTAEEKIKSFKNGTKRRYVYYHCTQIRDFNCHEKYIREDDLIREFEKIIEQIPIEKIEAQERIKSELFRYKNFTEGVLGQMGQIENQPQIDARTFAKYVLKQGTREEKRELLSCMNTVIYLKDSKLIL